MLFTEDKDKKSKKENHPFNRAHRRLLKARERGVDLFTKKTTANYRLKIISDEKKAALLKKIHKTVMARIKRDTFRQKIAKEQGVNWKRVRITNWRKLTYTIK